MMHFRSPRFGMLSPLATSYSSSYRDWYESNTLTEQLDTGITVSQAPLSTVTSISSHSPSLASEIGDN